MLEVQLAEAHANVASTESHETAMAEALKEAEDRHTQQLEDAYLVTRAKRRTLDTERQEPLVLERIPVHPSKKKENRCCSTTSTSTLEGIRSRVLAFPHPGTTMRGDRSLAYVEEEPTEAGNEAVWSDEVDELS